MPAGSALKAALMLLHMPTRARAMRAMPLPSDTSRLLQIAGNDAQAIDEAITESGRDEDVVRRAAAFFIEQVLWHPQADSYRVLGASPDADASDLKRNMTLLMSWLHPDVGPKDERSVFVARVTSAWNDLKTQERREDYSGKLARVAPPRGAKRQGGQRSRGSSAPRTTHRHVLHSARPGLMDRLLSFLRGAAPR